MKKFFKNVVISEEGKTIERPLAIDINHVGGEWDWYVIELKVGGATCFYEKYLVLGDEVDDFLHSLYDYGDISYWEGCGDGWWDVAIDDMNLNEESPFWLMSLYREAVEGEEEETWNVCAYASPRFFPEKRSKIIFRGTLNQMIALSERIRLINKAFNQEVLTPDDEENSEDNNNLKTLIK